MKKLLLLVPAIIALSFVSCTKETVKDTSDDITIQNPVKETITFSASINPDAFTKATLNDHNIHWTTGEYIGVANDQNDVIEACAITALGDPTKCSFTATAVENATTYYFVYYKGESSFSGITFNHTTATFSGLNCEGSRYGAGASSSHADLAMAGKSTDKSSVTMSPCLALIKLKAHANSVKANYANGYSGIRGVNVIMKNGGSALYVAGDYTIDLSDSQMAVTYVDNAAKKDHKQLSLEGCMDSNADYYLSIIPVGDITKIQLQFLGFKSDGSTWTWGDDAKDYQMSLSQNLSVDPGDFFDFGTLNPVDRQKAKDAFTPAITLDGVFDEWSSVTCSAAGSTTEGLDAVRLIKATADENYLYVYLELLDSKLYTNAGYTYSNRSYLYVGNGTGSSASLWASGKYEKKVEGWIKDALDPKYINWNDVIVNHRAYSSTSEGIIYMEMSIARSQVPGLQSGSASYAYIGFQVTDKYYEGGSSKGDGNNIGVAPAKDGAMLQVALPAYVKW